MKCVDFLSLHSRFYLGENMIYLKTFLLIITSVVLSSCSSLTLTPAEFSWPLESVLKIDNNGFVKEDRNSISFDTKALFL